MCAKRNDHGFSEAPNKGCCPWKRGRVLCNLGQPRMDDWELPWSLPGVQGCCGLRMGAGSQLGLELNLTSSTSSPTPSGSSPT